MARIDRDIDELYQLAPGAFTAARTALAKTLTGDEARRVRGLKKPTAVPWAVNQVFWKARPVYDRLLERGRALRTAQIGTLKGRKADVRAAADAHRRALGETVHRAQAIAAEAGLNPNADQLARMFEALSLAAVPPADAGRFTEPIEPMGFEALSGVTPVARPSEPADTAAARAKAEEGQRQTREAEARLRAATRGLEHAQERARSARQALKQAEADLAAAEQEVADARSQL